MGRVEGLMRRCVKLLNSKKYLRGDLRPWPLLTFVNLPATKLGLAYPQDISGWLQISLFHCSDTEERIWRELVDILACLSD